MVKKTIEWLPNALIRLQAHYCLCLSQEEFTKAVRFVEGENAHVGYWMKDPGAGATCNYSKDSNGEHVIYVCLRVTPEATPVQIAAMLCHEAVHIFQHQCEIMGEEKPSCEFTAWSIQFIAQCLMQQYADRL